jgi:hypothetical protein
MNLQELVIKKYIKEQKANAAGHCKYQKQETVLT